MKTYHSLLKHWLCMIFLINFMSHGKKSDVKLAKSSLSRIYCFVNYTFTVANLFIEVSFSFYFARNSFLFMQDIDSYLFK